MQGEPLEELRDARTRAKRDRAIGSPTKARIQMNDKKMMQLVGAVQRSADDHTKTWWTKIGVAFPNKDGSYNLRFDYLPARLSDTTIQLREIAPKEAAQPSE
jgi:hypothetical protein